MNDDPLLHPLIETSWRRKLTEAEMRELEAWLAAHPEALVKWQSEAALNEALDALGVKPSQLRIALAWAAVPQVVVVAIWIIGTVLAGRFLYMDPDRAVASGAGWTVLTIAFTNLASAVCAIWWLVLSVFTVAEAQGGSAWRALGTMILAALILGVVALLAIVVVVALSHP